MTLVSCAIAVNAASNELTVSAAVVVAAGAVVAAVVALGAWVVTGAMVGAVVAAGLHAAVAIPRAATKANPFTRMCIDASYRDRGRVGCANPSMSAQRLRPYVGRLADGSDSGKPTSPSRFAGSSGSWWSGERAMIVAMKGDRVEAVVDTGQGVQTFEIVATRAGRRIEVTTARGVVEVTEVTRGGTPVRTGRFMASRLIALVEHPSRERDDSRVEVSTRRRIAGAGEPR